MVDILIIKKENIFSVEVFGSPLGELNKVIRTPDLFSVELTMYNCLDSNWDVIILDSNFNETYNSLWDEIEKIKKIFDSWDNCPQIISVRL